VKYYWKIYNIILTWRTMNTCLVRKCHITHSYSHSRTCCLGLIQKHNIPNFTFRIIQFTLEFVIIKWIEYWPITTYSFKVRILSRFQGLMPSSMAPRNLFFICINFFKANYEHFKTVHSLVWHQFDGLKKKKRSEHGTTNGVTRSRV